MSRFTDRLTGTIANDLASAAAPQAGAPLVTGGTL
jgi:hypothetical protein